MQSVTAIESEHNTVPTLESNNIMNKIGYSLLAFGGLLIIYFSIRIWVQTCNTDSDYI